MIIKDTEGLKLKLTTTRLRELKDPAAGNWAVYAEDVRASFRNDSINVFIYELTPKGRKTTLRINVEFVKPPAEYNGLHGSTFSKNRVGCGRIGCRLFAPSVFRTIINAL